VLGDAPEADGAVEGPPPLHAARNALADVSPATFMKLRRLIGC
jgi:hypothetical protein